MCWEYIRIKWSGDRNGKYNPVFYSIYLMEKKCYSSLISCLNGNLLHCLSLLKLLKHISSTDTTCHNHTLMAADLRLCGTHSSARSELSLFVLASPTAKRRMLEPLALVQEESFRKRGMKDFERELRNWNLCSGM